MSKKSLIFSIIITLIAVAYLVFVSKWSEIHKEIVRYRLYYALKKYNNASIEMPGAMVTADGLKIFINGKNIKDFSPVGRLSCLSLGIKDISVPDLNFLTPGQKIKELSIMTTSTLTDISSLKHLKLEVLSIFAPNLTDISPIAEHPIKNLMIGCEKLSDLSPLKKLTKLKSLSLTGTFSNVDFLTELPQLERLFIRSNNVEDFSALKHLKNLKRLLIRNHNLTDFTFLQHLGNINSVYIDAGDQMIWDFDKIKISPSVKKFEYNEKGLLKELKRR